MPRYNIGPHSFTSKRAAKEHMTQIRERYGAGGDITERDDYSTIEALLRLHVKAEQK